ncbi:hypothetical protein J6590_046044 [Homalodisca vitripennis]|nr:hypothetical protein J6590_046044 [Homalodisca vitripennis]
MMYVCLAGSFSLKCSRLERQGIEPGLLAPDVHGHPSTKRSKQQLVPSVEPTSTTDWGSLRDRMRVGDGTLPQLRGGGGGNSLPHLPLISLPPKRTNGKRSN